MSVSAAQLRTKINLKPAVDHMKRLGVRVDEAMKSWVIEAGEIGVEIMRDEAPEKTGALKASIIAYRTKAYTIKIGPTVSHAVYVEFGTRPHVIAGKPVLSWIDEATGLRVWAAFVHHPGTLANPFVSRSRRRMSEVFRELVIRKLKEAVS
jgi:hypothetical protein